MERSQRPMSVPAFASSSLVSSRPKLNSLVEPRLVVPVFGCASSPDRQPTSVLRSSAFVSPRLNHKFFSGRDFRNWVSNAIPLRSASTAFDHGVVSAEAAKVAEPFRHSPPPVASNSSERTKKVDTLVVGAGLTGLSTAHFLSNAGTNVLVTESRDEVGGAIRSRSGDGFQWELGPNSFQPNPKILKLAVDVGLRDDLVLADGTLPRFVLWDGELNPLPMGPQDFNFKLLSWCGKVRAAAGAVGLKAPAPDKEETLSEFVRRNLGDEVFEKLIDPFVSGVYAGDPNKLSVRAAFAKLYNLEVAGGSLIGGSLKMLQEKKLQKVAGNLADDPSVPKTKGGELASFYYGLQQLPEAIAKKLGVGSSVMLEWTLRSIHPTPSGGFLAEFDTPAGPSLVECRSIVITSPAYVTANLIKHLSYDASQALSDIVYPSVASVSIAYPDSAFKMQPLRGFGNLLPRSQKIRTLGTIWTSCLFPNRAPEGWKLTTSFIGGAQDPALAECSEDEIADLVHEDVAKVLLKESVKPKVMSVTLWKKAIPQYNLGHLDRLDRVKRLEEEFPGLYISGNFTNGVAIGNCVEGGEKMANAVTKYLKENAARSEVSS
eukprot:CAMPEP_0196659094 /NCGR_PEP_ID=MMETSP1086-20130531/33057_1 /TAXON_ID=77921 /ORGANISM="Cyanoptyche  gloeocystis , Strain SAG4.97" /LENGTH=600 /DNA_ID=CAMNT_0041992935 /DNA_START=75 /DNA_END=1877 /DNA_ORIENTATION=+